MRFDTILLNWSTLTVREYLEFSMIGTLNNAIRYTLQKWMIEQQSAQVQRCSIILFFWGGASHNMSRFAKEWPFPIPP